jgi:integrase
LSTSCLGHWFATLCDDAGLPDVTLHRLRHSVATALVSRGDILQAQYRLGHRDAATTLRIYSHVLPLTDTDAAAALDHLYQS